MLDMVIDQRVMVMMVPLWTKLRCEGREPRKQLWLRNRWWELATGLAAYLWEGSFGKDTVQRSALQADRPSRAGGGDEDGDDGKMGYIHQQARLTAGTVAYNDKLPTDFRHVDWDLNWGGLTKMRRW
jgi:hypothetical protein